MDETVVEVPATITYAELVDGHLERLFRYLVLLLGDREVAEAETIAAFRRVWEDLEEGRIFGDTEETLYRIATRGALRRVSRSSELRGHLPPTTADDRLITAAGIITNFGPQQRAAIYLAVLGGVGYELAGRATGVGGARVRDLAFAARQEYRQERGAAPATTPTCAAIAALLSARADATLSADEEERVAAHLAECGACTQTAAAFDEFLALLKGMRLPAMPADLDERVRAEPAERRRRRPTGWRRMVRLASGPLILTIVLFAVLAFIQGFGEPSVKTGAGRTSDILYARAPDGGLLVLESGSGRTLGRAASAVLSADGRQAYSASSSCGAAGCRTTVSVTDTGTLQRTEVGRVEGQLAALAVDAAEERLLLADEAAGWGRAVVYELGARRLGEAITAPPGVRGAFEPRTAEASPDRTSLFTRGAAEGGRLPIVRTDLRTLQVAGTAQLPLPPEGGVDLVVGPAAGRVYAYETATGRLHELEPGGAGTVRSLDLSGRAAASIAPAGGDSPQGVAAVGPDGLLYAVARTGGIAVVDLARFEVLRRLNADRDYATVAISSDGKMLYVVDSSGAYHVLDATSGEQLLRRADVATAGLLQVNRGE